MTWKGWEKGTEHVQGTSPYKGLASSYKIAEF